MGSSIPCATRLRTWLPDGPHRLEAASVAARASFASNIERCLARCASRTGEDTATG